MSGVSIQKDVLQKRSSNGFLTSEELQGEFILSETLSSDDVSAVAGRYTEGMT